MLCHGIIHFLVYCKNKRHSYCLLHLTQYQFSVVLKEEFRNKLHFTSHLPLVSPHASFKYLHLPLSTTHSWQMQQHNSQSPGLNPSCIHEEKCQTTMHFASNGYILDNYGIFHLCKSIKPKFIQLIIPYISFLVVEFLRTKDQC